MSIMALNFIDTGLDDTTLEFLSKASRPGLVQKEITVKGKNGKTFTRKQWVKASDDDGSDDSKSSVDLGTGSKADIAAALANGATREEIMDAAKAAGVTWTENDHAGINWMRASMAIQKAGQANPDIFKQPAAQQPATDAKDDTKDAKDTKDDKKTVGLDDLLSDIPVNTQPKDDDAKAKNDILKGIDTNTMSDYEKDKFGDIIKSASPENLRNYRTLGMCAGDKESEEYLDDLYTKYSVALGAPTGYDPNVDADPLRNKLQGVVNKQVVGVVKSSLSNVRSRIKSDAFMNKLFEPWVDPNTPITDEEKSHIKNMGLNDRLGASMLGDNRKSYMTERDGNLSLMKRYLEKMQQHPDYKDTAKEVLDKVNEYTAITQGNRFINEVSMNGHSDDQYMKDHPELKLKSPWSAGAFHDLDNIEDRLNTRINNLTKHIEEIDSGTSRYHVKPDEQRKVAERSVKQYREQLKQVEEARDILKKYEADGSAYDKLKEAQNIRHDLAFGNNEKYQDVIANLYHEKMMGAQLAYQYFVNRDFVDNYPILSHDNIDKLEKKDQTSLENLALYAGMFKPSLAKNGKDAKDAIKDKYSERQAFLDAYGGVKAVNTTNYAENNEIRCKISKASDAKAQEITDNIAKDWDNSSHGHMKYKIKGVYQVSGLEVEKDFDQIKSKNSRYSQDKSGGKTCSSDMFYHGTGSMATSLILGHSGQFKLVKAKVGRMLGDGIYLADKSSKSAQYIGDAGYSRSGIEGSLMVVEASLGNTLNQRTSNGNGYDSVFAGKQHGLLNNEWCVHDPKAVIPRYLVHMEIL